MFGEKMTLIQDVAVVGKMVSTNILIVAIGDIIKYVIMYPSPAMAAVNYSFMKISFSFGNFSAEAKGQESPETQI